jgi:hypothetical protein
MLMKQYKELVKKLMENYKSNRCQDYDKQDEILEQMDIVWEAMSPEEQEKIEWYVLYGDEEQNLPEGEK